MEISQGEVHLDWRERSASDDYLESAEFSLWVKSCSHTPSSRVDGR
jgi:hypothetical protein